MRFEVEPLGFIRTPFADKFGIPRQPQLAPSARGTLTLLPPFNRAEAVRELDTFSHLWLTFVFHQADTEWRPMVRPPRLGGNARVGVFASRSPFRPNRLGLSLVRLEHVDTQGGVTLTLSGVDLVDGTPIVDIKPYIPFVESQPDAIGGFVDGPPLTLTVQFATQAESQLGTLGARAAQMRALIREVLAQDPRPAYAGDAGRVYGVRLYEFDIKWTCDGSTAHVLSLDPV
ncbi:tRNA (N6-threonylcarbamoyladenosine(37)-N6)-methyltransferase TrmO [Chitinibacteraceae bacterium HSL-7]